MKNSRSSIDTRTIVKAGFLTSLSIVLTRFFAVMLPIAGAAGSLRLSFGEIPLMISGLLFGPLVGGISGLAADLIGVVVNTQGTFHPGFTLSSILWGAIPGVFSIFYKKSSKRNIFSIERIFITVFTCIVIISLGLNTYWLSTLMGKGFIVLFPARALSALVNIPLQSFIIKTLMKYLNDTVRA